MNKQKNTETGEEDRKGDKGQTKIEGRRRRGKKKKQGTSDSEIANSEMGCETQYERENQKGPGETKGDTEKLRKFLLWGKAVVFYVFWLVHTNQKSCAKKEREKISSHMLQTRVFKKNHMLQPPS